MAVLISTSVKNQTQEGYDSVLNAVKESIQKALDLSCIARMPQKENGKCMR